MKRFIVLFVAMLISCGNPKIDSIEHALSTKKEGLSDIAIQACLALDGELNGQNERNGYYVYNCESSVVSPNSAIYLIFGMDYYSEYQYVLPNLLGKEIFIEGYFSISKNDNGKLEIRNISVTNISEEN